MKYPGEPADLVRIKQGLDGAFQEYDSWVSIPVDLPELIRDALVELQWRRDADDDEHAGDT